MTRIPAYLRTERALRPPTPGATIALRLAVLAVVLFTLGLAIAWTS